MPPVIPDEKQQAAIDKKYGGNAMFSSPSMVLSGMDQQAKLSAKSALDDTAMMRIANATFIANKWGLDIDQVERNYEAIAEQLGYTGNAANDYNSIKGWIEANEGRQRKFMDYPNMAVRGLTAEGAQAAIQGTGTLALQVAAFGVLETFDGDFNKTQQNIARIKRQIKDIEFDERRSPISEKEDVELRRLEEELAQNREALEMIKRNDPIITASKEFSEYMADARQYARDSFPVSQEAQESFFGQVTQGVGQLLGTLPFYAISGVGPVSTVGQTYQEAFDDAMEITGSFEAAHEAGVKNVPAAALEVVGDKLILGRLARGFKGKMTVREFSKMLLASGISEGSTEAAQQYWLNVNAKFLSGYDPDRMLDDEVINSFLVGAVVGGGVQTVTTAPGAFAERNPIIDSMQASELPMSKEDWKGINENFSDEEVVEMSMGTELEQFAEDLVKAKNGDLEAQQKIHDEVAPEITPVDNIDPIKTVESAADSLDGESVTPETRQQAVSDIAEATYEATIPFMERVAAKIEKTGDSINKVTQLFTSLSTRIGEISKIAKSRVRRMDQQENIMINKGIHSTDPFIDSFNNVSKKLSEDDKKILFSEILNGEYDKLAARGITGIEELRGFLESQGKRIPQVKGLIENYFPRNMKFRDKFLDEMIENPRGIFSQALFEAESKKGKPLTIKEKRSVIRGVLQKRDQQGAIFTKSRSITIVTPEMTQYYENPLETLRGYIHRSAQVIARNDFLGIESSMDLENVNDQSEDVVIPEKAFADLINEIEKKEGIDFKDERVIRSLIQSRLNFKTTPKIIQIYRKGVSLRHVTGVKTALLQFADTAVNVYENGLNNLSQDIFDKEKFINEFGAEISLSLEDAGIEQLDQEYRETLKVHNDLSKIALTPLRTADTLNKKYLLHSMAKAWRRDARGSDESVQALKTDLMSYFRDGDFVDTVIRDIAESKISPDVRFALYSRMADFHPLGVSEYVQFYIDHPVARAAFTLKSFAFKRFDTIYRESLRDMIKGNTLALAATARGDMVGFREGARQASRGMIALAKILGTMVLAETAIDYLWLQLLGALKDDDKSKENAERSFASIYLQETSQMFPLFNPYGFKKGVREGNPTQAIISGASLPDPLFADSMNEFMRYFIQDDYTINKMEFWGDLIPPSDPFLPSKKSNKKKSTTSRKTSSETRAR